MKAGLHRGWVARLARRFLRHERGSISPLFVLLLIPICGVMGMGVELGNATLLQRVAQHAADSAAITAATRNDATLANDQLEAQGVLANYPSIGSNPSVSIALATCPGSSLTNDCYAATVSGAAPSYLSQVIGIRSLPVRAIAYARTKSTMDLCLVTYGSNGLTDNGNTGTYTDCTVEALSGTLKCSSNGFGGGIFVSDQACNGKIGSTTQLKSANPYTLGACPSHNITLNLASGSSTTYADFGARPCLASSIPNTGQVPCSSKTKISDISWSNGSTDWVTYSGTNYIRLCGGTTTNNALAASLTVPSNTNPQAIILDNFTINGPSNFNFTASNTTIIGTNSGGGQIPDWFTTNASTVTVAAPYVNTNGTFSSFAFYDNENLTAASYAPGNGNTFNVTGEIYAPARDLTFKGSVTSNINSITCITIVSGSVYSNGGDLGTKTSPVANCSGNYIAPVAVTANVMLVK